MIRTFSLFDMPAKFSLQIFHIKSAFIKSTEFTCALASAMIFLLTTITACQPQADKSSKENYKKEAPKPKYHVEETTKSSQPSSEKNRFLQLQQQRENWTRTETEAYNAGHQQGLEDGEEAGIARMPMDSNFDDGTDDFRGKLVDYYKLGYFDGYYEAYEESSLERKENEVYSEDDEYEEGESDEYLE